MQYSSMLRWALPTLLATTVAGTFHPMEDAAAELQMRNKLALYAQAVDFKDFSRLSDVYAPKVEVNYTAVQAPPIHDVKTFAAFLEKATHVSATTEHFIDSIVIEHYPGKNPNSTAYVSAVYSGYGPKQGQLATVYGYYHDEWTKIKGQWYISKTALFGRGYGGDFNLTVPDGS